MGLEGLAIGAETERGSGLLQCHGEATRARLQKPYELRALGGVVVKGKTRTVEIFEVIAPSPLVAEAVVDAAGAKDKTI